MCARARACCVTPTVSWAGPPPPSSQILTADLNELNFSCGKAVENGHTPCHVILRAFRAHIRTSHLVDTVLAIPILDNNVIYTPVEMPQCLQRKSDQPLSRAGPLALESGIDLLVSTCMWLGLSL